MHTFKAMERRTEDTYSEIINKVVSEQKEDHVDMLKIVLMDIKEIEYVKNY